MSEDRCRPYGIPRVGLPEYLTPEQTQQAIRDRIDLLKIAAARWEPRQLPERNTHGTTNRVLRRAGKP